MKVSLKIKILIFASSLILLSGITAGCLITFNVESSPVEIFSIILK
jgi:hypothetical protein